MTVSAVERTAQPCGCTAAVNQELLSAVTTAAAAASLERSTSADNTFRQHHFNVMVLLNSKHAILSLILATDSKCHKLVFAQCHLAVAVWLSGNAMVSTDPAAPR